MILSHNYKSIFIKNVKMGDTSIEIGLSKFCGEKDIITKISDEYFIKEKILEITN